MSDLEKCAHGYWTTNFTPCPWCHGFNDENKDAIPVEGPGNGWLLLKGDPVCTECGGPAGAGWGLLPPNYDPENPPPPPTVCYGCESKDLFAGAEIEDEPVGPRKYGYAQVHTFEDFGAWLNERGYHCTLRYYGDEERKAAAAAREAEGLIALDAWAAQVEPRRVRSLRLSITGRSDTVLEAMREAVRGWDDYENGRFKPQLSGAAVIGPDGLVSVRVTEQVK